jgi:rhodanese-related sulfurtransferase
MPKLVPYLGTPTVVCDDDEHRAALAADTLTAMGYSDVRVLAGGLNRWASEDLPTEWGVNVPSKDFGEQVFEQEGIREITPDELHSWQSEGRDLLLLDTRTPEEHAASTIPGSRSIPGGELAMRVPALLDSPDQTVVVHCAGRTRGIVGAQTLARMGVRNVYYLKNGTMGWVLAGLDLEKGSDRLGLPVPSADVLRETEARVRALADADGVTWLDFEGLQSLTKSSAHQNVSPAAMEWCVPG